MVNPITTFLLDDPLYSVYSTLVNSCTFIHSVLYVGFSHSAFRLCCLSSNFFVFHVFITTALVVEINKTLMISKLLAEMFPFFIVVFLFFFFFLFISFIHGIGSSKTYRNILKKRLAIAKCVILSTASVRAHSQYGFGY